MTRIFAVIGVLASLLLLNSGLVVEARAEASAQTEKAQPAPVHRVTDAGATRRHRRQAHVYGPYYRPYWRWHRPYYVRPYYPRNYFRPYYRGPYGYDGAGYVYSGWGPRYYALPPSVYGWGPRYNGCCGWGWSGPRFYGPAYGLGYGF